MTNPYELWQTHDLLGVFRDSKPENWYFGRFFTQAMRSESEWIDFEKLPIRSRRLAPFVKPMGRGHGVFTDKVQGFRFKPANIVVEDSIDPLRPLTYQPGIDSSILHHATDMDPMTRRSLIKLAMVDEFQTAVERRWEWMRSKAVIDGKVTVVYKDGTSVLVDFQRANAHTEVLSSSYWGNSGVSILDHIQTIIDTVNAAEFGGMVDRITMGNAVAAVLRKDAEILAHMDLTIAGGVHKVDRGLTGGDKIYKFGELFVGGASGHVIELWVNNETYTDESGTQVRYLGSKEVLFTCSPESVNGYECYGRIVDSDASYQAIPMFPKNFETGERVKVENISIESAPLFVPINPNTTYKLTPLA